VSFRLFVVVHEWHDRAMGDDKPKWSGLRLKIEFWFALLLTIVTFLYGAWHTVRALAAGWL